MYRKHFGLPRHVFDNEIDVDALFESKAAKELEARLTYLFTLRGIGLVTGDAGTGKTTIARKVTSGLHQGLHRVFYVPLSTGNVMDLYKSIAWELGLPTERSRAALYKCIRDEVSRLCLEAKIKPILIIDEAQNLRSEVLEDLRLLTNYRMDSENRLTLLFIGQAELRRRLSMAVHEALSQRIVVRHHVTGLERDEVGGYLAHMLKLAGTETQLFEPAAVEAIFQATNGLPRKVVRTAHHALNAAAATRAKTVGPDHVEAATAEVT